jgi:hypothetical protein
MGRGVYASYDNDWIITKWRLFKNWSKLCSAYNEAHGTNIGYNTFKSHCNRELKLNYHYTDEQLEWLRVNYPRLGRVKCQKEFNAMFNEDRSIQGLRVMCTKMGLTVTKERRKETAIENTGRCYPIGAVIKKAHDEPYIKTEHGWKRLKDMAYGSKPKGYVIAHLDQNVDNYSRDNLVAISRSVHIRMAHNKFWSKDPEITKTGILCCELEQMLGLKEEE